MTPERRNHLMTRSDLETKEGNKEQAKKTLKSVVDQFPGDVEAGHRLAQVYVSLGEVKPAKELLLANLVAAPWHKESRELLATIEAAEAQPNSRPPMIAGPMRYFLGSVLILGAALLLGSIWSENKDDDEPPSETVLTCGAPEEEEDSSGEPAASAASVSFEGTLTVGGVKINVSSDKAPAELAVEENGSANALPAEPSPDAIDDAATEDEAPGFPGADCTSANAVSAKVTTKEAGGALKDVPFNYLAIIGGLFLIGVLIILLPYVKSFGFGTAKIELFGEPEGTSRQPPAASPG